MTAVYKESRQAMIREKKLVSEFTVFNNRTTDWRLAKFNSFVPPLRVNCSYVCIYTTILTMGANRTNQVIHARHQWVW